MHNGQTQEKILLFPNIENNVTFQTVRGGRAEVEKSDTAHQPYPNPTQK